MYLKFHQNSNHVQELCTKVLKLNIRYYLEVQYKLLLQDLGTRSDLPYDF